jgi:hypothetical protein
MSGNLILPLSGEESAALQCSSHDGGKSSNGRVISESLSSLKRVYKRYNKNKVEMLNLACKILIKVVTIESEEIRLCMYRIEPFHVNACFMQMPCMCCTFPVPSAYEALHTCKVCIV